MKQNEKMPCSKWSPRSEQMELRRPECNQFCGTGDCSTCWAVKVYFEK